jgi:dephospho-CoA kinase
MSTITLIGLTGLPGSGKGEFVRFVQQLADLKCLQFAHYSLSDVLREEARKRGRTVERPVLHEIGNSLRAERGPGALASIVLTKLNEERALIRGDQIVVIDAIRTPEEIAVFREQFGTRFHMVALDAPNSILTERIAFRARHDESQEVVRDRKRVAELLANELGNGEPRFGLNIRDAMLAADHILDNSGTIEKLRDASFGLLATLIDRSPDCTLVDRGNGD